MSKSFDLDKFGGFNLFHWDHEYLVKVLTTGKEPIVRSLYLKNALKNIKREDFIPQKYIEIAYEDKEIPLGYYNATLDKPTVIARMLELMRPRLGGKYLDIGTGSGYVAALLGYASGVEGQVFSMERIQILADVARQNIQKYPNIKNVQIFFGNGAKGIPTHAPYDGIHLSVSFEQIPSIIINQLKIGGRLVGPTLENDIRLIERKSAEEFDEKVFPGYFFVPSEQGVI